MSARKPSRARGLGVSDEDYERMLAAQDGGCAICGAKPKTRRLHVDHRHGSTFVRGLLCYRCNRALPHYLDSTWLRNATAYVIDAERREEIERIAGQGLRDEIAWYKDTHPPGAAA